MRRTIYTMHDVEPEHLAVVTEQMRTLGAPTIRVVDCGDYWYAIEGTHRLHAAAALGLMPDFEVLAQDVLVLADSLDWDDLQIGESYPASDLVQVNHECQVLAFEVA